jgi:Flp pilus assembly pilin Flp
MIRPCGGRVRLAVKAGSPAPFEEEAPMPNVVRNVARAERGGDLIEYGLLVAFVVAVVMVTVIADPLGINGTVVSAFHTTADALRSASH